MVVMGEADDLGAGGEIEFVVDAPEMGFHGATAEEEAFGHFGVGQPTGYKPDDFNFAEGESIGKR